MEPNIDSFLSQTGCMIYQRQGQRFCQTLKAFEYIKLPGKGHEVFVAKLPRDCYEHEIYPMFSIVGDIYETRIMMAFSGSNRGFCYIKYFTRQAADNAVELLHNQEIRPGHRLIVKKSLERNTLTVYNVDERVDEITAAKELQTIVENMTEVRIVATFRQANVTFNCHRSATIAMKYFAIDMQRVFGPNARITWSCPVTVKERIKHKLLQTVTAVMEPNINSFLSQTGCMIYQREGQRFCQTLKAFEYNKLPGKGHEVYIAKLPRDCYEDEIYPMFSIVGYIYETHIMMAFSGSNRGFCYIKYFTRQAADNAVELLHNQEFRPGHRLIVKKSLERNTLTVYNVDESVDEITAAKELQTIVENMTEVRIVATFRQANVTFNCHRSATIAMKYFAIDMQRVFGPNARITWSCPVTVKERIKHKLLQPTVKS